MQTTTWRMILCGSLTTSVMTAAAAAQGPAAISILGGSSRDLVFDIAVDPDGHIYVVGETWSPDFPIVGAVQGTLRGTSDAFVAKLSPGGTQLIYATYLGGSGFDSGRSIAVDAAGHAYVTGYTASSDFPLANALDANRGGPADAFIVKLNPQGNALLFSTYFGGNSDDNADAIALDSQGGVYVAGRTHGGLPVINAAQSTFGGVEDAFVAKLGPGLTAYEYVTYLGGGLTDIVGGLGVDGLGRACVAGFTQSADFPLVNGPTPGTGGNGDAFFTLLAAGGNSVLVSSPLGGSGEDWARGVACTADRLAVVGHTVSTDFPTGGTTGAQIQTVLGGDRDGFLAVFDVSSLPAVSREFTTLIGGRRDDRLADVTITPDGDVHVSGDTESSGLPEVGVAAAGLTGAGVFRSSDGGATWQAAGFAGIGINDFARAAATPERLLAATDLGLHVSADGGATWQRQDTGLAARPVHAVDVDPGDACTWVIGIDSDPDDGTTPVGAARTSDCGASWAPWGFSAHRFRRLQRLGDPNRLVVTVDQVAPATEGTDSDTCVVDRDGGLVRCFDQGTSDNVIAVDDTSSCRWVEANAAGAVWQMSGNAFGCDHPFGFTNLGNLGAPATALAVTGTPAGRAIYAGLGNGTVQSVFPDVTTPPTWTSTFIPVPYPVLALEPTSSGDVIASSGPSAYIVSGSGSVTQLSPQTGASGFKRLDIGASVIWGAAGPTRDLYWQKRLGADLSLGFADHQGSACDDEMRAVATNAILRYHAWVISNKCRLENRGEFFGVGFQAENVAVTTVPGGSGPPPCTTSVALETDTLDASQLNGAVVNFSNTGTCDVTPVSNASWIRVGRFAGAPGSAGWVDLQFDSNAGAARTGTVTIGGQTLTVTQAEAAPDDLAVWTDDASFGPGGGPGLAKVRGDVYLAEVVEGLDFLEVHTDANPADDVTGAGSVGYTVAPNPGLTTRTGRIRLVGVGGAVKDVVITQAGAQASCASPPTVNIVSAPSAGGSVSFSVVAPPTCVHTSAEDTLAAGGPVFVPDGTPDGVTGVTGTGPGTLTVEVGANAGLGRVFNVTVAGHTVTVIQAAGDAEVDTRANLAEGATIDPFDTEINLANPSDATTVVATATFTTTSGQAHERSVLLFPLSRGTIGPKSIPGLETAEFSTSLAADGPLVAARVMEWDASGYGSHGESGIPGPATTWYLAEGATHSGFELFYLLQNPGATAADVEVRYLRPAPLAPIVKTYTVAPRSRFNIWVNLEDPGLASTDVSAVLTSTNGVPVVVERAMYLSNQGRPFNAGHESAGVTAPATEWYLAEGATGAYFDEFILIANPGGTPAEVTAEYLLENGSTIVRTYTIAAASRFNIWVDYEAPWLADAAVSVRLTSTNGIPVIVERAMWWPGDGAEWHEAHNSPGATQTGTRWALAAGEQGGAAAHETYVLIANTSAFEGEVQVTVMMEGDASVLRTVMLPPTSRTNVPIGLTFPEAVGRKFGVLVESLGDAPAQLVVEGAIYSNSDGVAWAAGANLLATRLPDQPR